MIRFGFATLAALSLFSCKDEAGAPVSPNAAEANLSDLIGVWDIALFYDPSEPPSATVMEISSIEDGEVAGAFYGAAFSSAQATIHRGEIIFSAVTSDGSGPYTHAGRLTSDGDFFGQTLSTGRGFVMAWEATRHTAPTDTNE